MSAFHTSKQAYGQNTWKLAPVFLHLLSSWSGDIISPLWFYFPSTFTLRSVSNLLWLFSAAVPPLISKMTLHGDFICTLSDWEVWNFCAAPLIFNCFWFVINVIKKYFFLLFPSRKKWEIVIVDPTQEHLNVLMDTRWPWWYTPNI